MQEGKTGFSITSDTGRKETQLVLMDESAVEHFYSISHINEMKKLHEGDGYNFELKAKDAVPIFKNCAILVCSNKLP